MIVNVGEQLNNYARKQKIQSNPRSHPSRSRSWASTTCKLLSKLHHWNVARGLEYKNTDVCLLATIVNRLADAI